MRLISKISGVTGAFLLAPLMAMSSPLTVAELALHRIEKLVQLNRIEAAYISNFQNISVEALTQVNPNDPAFKSVVSQTEANEQDAPPRVNLLHKSDGKVLSHTVAAGVPGAALTWPNKDPLTISEAALHYIEEHSQHQAPLLVFDVGFKDLTVGQDTRNGVLVAIVNVTSNNSNQYAEFVVGMDGVVQSWSLK